MSRYYKIVGVFEYAWGYDDPLQEYFVQKFNLDPDLTDDEDDVVYSIGSHCTTKPHYDFPDKEHWSNDDIIELMERINKEASEPIIPINHIQAVAMDLPF